MSQHSISEYFNRIAVFPSVSMADDGSKLAYVSSVTGSPQIWVGEMSNGLLSYPKPVTSGKDKQPHVMTAGLQWIGSHQLACLMDQHGDEQTFIEILNFKDGSTLSVPREVGARDYLGFVSEDRKTLYFSSNRGNPRSQGLYSFDLRTKTVKCVLHHDSETSGWFDGQTYRGSYLFYRVSATNSNTLHAVHPRTKKVVDLFTEPNTQITPLGECAGGRLLVIANYQRQFLSLAFFDVKKKTFGYLARDQWDVEEAKLSPDKKHLLVARNLAGRSVLELYQFPKMKKLPLSFSTRGVIEALRYSKDGRSVIFAYSSPTEPRNFYCLDLRTRKAQPLTDNWISRIPKKDFVHPQLVRYRSQERDIYSWLYLPKKAKWARQLPVIVWPHGGPQAQERALFRPVFQYFVGRGFAIWAPNPTGSSGFGKDFTNAICGQWGTADLPDMSNGVEWLTKSGWVDPKKIFIMGGSYGGYMTLRSITKIAKTFRAAVDIFGVSNLITFVHSVPPDWKPFMDRLVGDPVAESEKLREQSPLYALERVDCPLMVIQGAKDPRVVKAESDQVVDTLKKLGKPVEYLVFEDEGHGFLKLENELKAFTAAAKFLEGMV